MADDQYNDWDPWDEILFQKKNPKEEKEKNEEEKIIKLICDEIILLTEKELDRMTEVNTISGWFQEEIDDGQLFFMIWGPKEEKEQKSEKYSVCSIGGNNISFCNDADYSFELNVEKSTEWKNFYKYCDGYSQVTSYYFNPTADSNLKDVKDVKMLVAEIIQEKTMERKQGNFRISM